MKKILIISDVWHPQVNGVLTFIENIVPRLKERDFDVEIIHPELFTNFPLPFYPEIRIPIFTKKKIESIIMNGKHDHIHIMTESVLGFSARRICTNNNLCFSSSFHTDFPQYIAMRTGFSAKIIYKYLKWFHAASKNTTIASQSLKLKLEEMGFKNLSFWNGGVNTDTFQVKTAALLQDYKRPIFVYMGRIAIEKNVEEFLKCTLPGTKLVIGDGPLRKKLEEKYSDAIFVGYKKGQELADLLASCDVFVFPSRTDTFGLTIIEAMACGLPVAAHDVVGPRDIISHGVDGFLDEDLANAAFLCLSLSKDDCRNKSLMYSWKNSTKQFVENLIFSGFN